MKDRKNLKLLGSIAAVIIISALILSCVSILVEDKFSDTKFLDRQNVNEFYSLEKNTVDVLAIGTSQVLSGFAAPELYLEHGISAFGLATCNQPIFSSYYRLLEALETQAPKVVMLEMSALYSKKEEDETTFFKAISTMKNTSKYKLQAVNEIAQMFEGTDKLSYYSKLYKFHSRWEKISKQDYAFLKNFERPTFGGAAVISSIIEEPYDIDSYLVKKLDSVQEYETEVSGLYLEKIAQLCKEKGIELIFYKTPKSGWTSDYYTRMLQYSEKLNVPYIDFNVKDVLMSLNLDLRQDFVDQNHLNATGAKKLTNYLGKYLAANFNLPDRRNDPNYKMCEKTSKEYTQVYNSALIKRSENLSEILSLAQGKDYLILIAKGGNVDCTKIDKQIQKLGFEGSLSDKSNAVLAFENGKLVKSTLSDENITMSKYFSNKINYQVYHTLTKTTMGIFGKNCSVYDTEDYVSVCIYDNIAKLIVYSDSFDANLNLIVEEEESVTA